MEKQLLILGVALCCGLALKLWRAGLLAQYRILFVYALFTAVRVSVPLIVGWRNPSSAYANWWVLTEAISWIIYVVLVLELYSAIFYQFPALASFGKKIFQLAIGVSVVVALAGMFLFSPTVSKYPGLDALLITRRVIMTSLIVFLILLLFSMSWFRVKLKKNTIIHAIVFFVYFLAKAGVVFVLQSVGFKVLSTVNLILLGISNLCILVWIVGLTRTGEMAQVAVGHQWNPEKGERLVEQLAALNSTLARSNRGSVQNPVQTTVRSNRTP